ncbi:adenosylcobinamide-phosphate synthase CbiB [Hydrocarboniclastica marina]|uniref:adenosylcobinamide-phosphate synthase CbiB n=1 Tax=Hydrocarboniclastica marina TaxID=2259620 RepID=UPI001C12AC23|nr:adenosylcobinamide-phosphate synthase CbiB [Hydrocarboniclastica marina]
MDNLPTLLIVCTAALLLDLRLGEPRRFHPLVLFGTATQRLELRFNRSGHRILRGALGLFILVGPPVLVAALVARTVPSLLLPVVEAVVLWLALSLRGLTEHARAVAQPLRTGDLEQARAQVGRIVSRRTGTLDMTGVASAATESVLENGADAIFASLFWYLVLGLPGVVLHRAVNTLDAMWGYRNERFLEFGRVAARLDDLLNWVPARLTALTYALVGQTRLALACWRRQAPQWDSPNAGPVMAAGAGALGVALGGPAPYGEGIKQRPRLGAGSAADADTIEQAVRLVQRGVWLWLFMLAAATVWFVLTGELSVEATNAGEVRSG